jgi:nucleoid DNA-binding protein
MEAWNKPDFVKHMRKAHPDWDHATASNAYDRVFGTLRDAIVGGNSVTVIGVGSFYCKFEKPKETIHRIFKTILKLPARVHVRYTASKLLVSAASRQFQKTLQETGT